MKALTDSIMARAQNSRHGFRAWHETLPPKTREELEALRAKWRAGETGLKKRSMARAIVAELQARQLRVSGVQGVEDWLDKKD
jgi:hypothetical protein